MQRSLKLSIIIATIIIAAFSVVFWIVPVDNSATKALAYIFVVIAYIVCIYSFYQGLIKGKDVKSKVYGFPIVKVGVGCVIIQTAVSIAMLIVLKFIAVPAWIMVVIGVIICCISLVGVLTTDIVRDAVETQDRQISTATGNINYFRVDMQHIILACNNSEIRKKLERLAEKFQYSDPVSNDATKEIEEAIKREIEGLEGMIKNADKEMLNSKIEDITRLLEDRNRRCKLGKQ